MNALFEPLLLGFDTMEKTLERIAKGGREGSRPYNIESQSAPPPTDPYAERLRITPCRCRFGRTRTLK